MEEEYATCLWEEALVSELEFELALAAKDHAAAMLSGRKWHFAAGILRDMGYNIPTD